MGPIDADPLKAHLSKITKLERELELLRAELVGYQQRSELEQDQAREALAQLAFDKRVLHVEIEDLEVENGQLRDRIGTLEAKYAEVRKGLEELREELSDG
jgi:chromosome segregation ATPase